MNSSAYGLIHDYYPREKMISLEKEGKLEYFYFSKSQFKEFEKSMMYRSVFVFFDYSTKTTKVLKNTLCYSIVNLHRITVETMRGPLTLYSIQNKKSQTIEEIKKIEYKMFVDFEFTMPAYQDRLNFTPELLQIGAVISDKDERIVNEYSTYIETIEKPTDRTLRFLKIYKEDLEDMVSSKEFYLELKNLVDIYSPTIFVWGGNDVKTLESFYKLHNFEPLKIKVIDLLKVIRNYYNLNTDIGLFRALKYFNGIDASQAHHALTDAAATKEVFDAFKSKLGTDFDLKEIIVKEQESKIAQEIEESINSEKEENSLNEEDM